MMKRFGNQTRKTGEGKGPERAGSKIAAIIGPRSSDGVARHFFRVKGGGMKKLTLQTSRTVTMRSDLIRANMPIPEKEVTGRG